MAADPRNEREIGAAIETDATAPIGVDSDDLARPREDDCAPAETHFQSFGDVAEGDYAALKDIDSGDYIIKRELARGGMGRILEGHDRRVGRDVAIKEILAPLLAIYPEGERAEVLRRFEREARITARLEHPAIIPVYEIGRLDGVPFFAMKKVDGRPLDKLISEAPTLADRLRLLPNVIAISDALGYAHDRGVIHRDLKPANVLVGAHGETVVIDWGLAKQFDADDAETTAPPVLPDDDGLRTVAGAVFGTPLYMPPEQARGEAVDRRGDVYALGAILYHLLAGKPAYSVREGRNRGSVLERLREGPPRPLAEITTDVPPDLLSIVEKSMARDKDARYPSAIELAADLRDFEAGKLVAVHAYSFGELFRRWLGRHRAALATATVGLVALVAASAVLVQKVRSARDDAQGQAIGAERSRANATRLFTELGRASLLRDQLVEGSFNLIQAGLLGADVPGLHILLGSIEETMTGVVVRIAAEPVQSSRFSRDGSTLVIGLRSGEIRLLEGATGGERARFFGAPDLVSIAIDADATQIAVSTKAGVMELWDVASRRIKHRFECEGDDVPFMGRGDAVLSPNGELLAVGCPGVGATLYSSATGKMIGTVPLPLPGISVLFSSKGDRLLVQSANIVAKIVDLEKRRSVVDKQLATTGSAQVSYSFDLRRAASLDKGGVTFFDFESGETFALTDTFDNVEIILMAPSGRYVLLGFGDGYLGRFDLGTRTMTARWRAHPAPVSTMNLSDDEKILVTVGDDLLVRTWDAESTRQRASFLGLVGIGTPIISGDRLSIGDSAGVLLIDASHDEATVTPLPDAGQVAVSYSGDSRARRIDGPRATTISQGDQTMAFSPTITRNGTSGFSRDGARVALANGIYDVRSGKLISALPGDRRELNNITLSADGSRAASAFDSDSVSVWDVETREIVWTESRFGIEEAPMTASLSGDGGVVAVAWASGEVAFTEISTGEQVRYPLPGVGRMWTSADGTRLVLNVRAETGLWDLPNKRRIATLSTATSQAALSADARFIVATNRPGDEITLYDGATGKKLRKLDQGPAPTQTTQLAVNGGVVAAVDILGEIRLWDASSGAVLRRRRLGSMPTSLAIAPNGKEMSVSTETELVVYEIAENLRTPDQLLDRLREIYPASFLAANFLLTP